MTRKGLSENVGLGPTSLEQAEWNVSGLLAMPPVKTSVLLSVSEYGSARRKVLLPISADDAVSDGVP